MFHALLRKPFPVGLKQLFQQEIDPKESDLIVKAVSASKERSGVSLVTML
jgi:hypothetical protein